MKTNESTHDSLIANKGHPLPIFTGLTELISPPVGVFAKHTAFIAKGKFIPRCSPQEIVESNPHIADIPVAQIQP